MSAAFTQWLGDMLLASGALMALALILRRPVAHLFGPQIGYALWLLPLIRVALPPLELPARFAPVGDAEMLTMPGDALPAAMANAAPLLLPDVGAGLLALWLAGALTLLGWRLWQYRKMRRALLADALPVGEAGRVRLVETPLAVSPLAFGIVDQVVALPMGFMASPRTPRDLAIAHEVAHHRGGDLLANLAAQIVLAMHWFNPLAWAAWRAMRRDQEAACDARVVAGRSQSERITYAQVIAYCAAGPRVQAACPLASGLIGRGEKAIIHRLRHLALPDAGRGQRMAGKGALLGGALALPLTATINYAEPDAPQTALAEARQAVVSQLGQAPAATNPPAAPRTPLHPDEAQAATSMAQPTQRGGVTFAQAQGRDRRTIDVVTRCTTQASAEAQDCAVTVVASGIAELKRARLVVASARMPESNRAGALDEIDAEIARMRDFQPVAWDAVAPPAPPKPQAVVSITLRYVIPLSPVPAAVPSPAPRPSSGPVT